VLVTHLSCKYVMYIHRERGQEKANVTKDMHKCWVLFSLVVFSNPVLIFKAGELLNTRSARLAEPTFPRSLSLTPAVGREKNKLAPNAGIKQNKKRIPR